MTETPLNIDEIRCPGEKAAFIWLLIASVITAVGLTISIVGLVYLVIFALLSELGKIFAMAGIRGQGIRVNAQQYPTIHEYARNFAQRLGLKHEPEIYVLQATLMNAFATKVIRRRYVVL